MSDKEVKVAWDRHWEMGGSLEENASWFGRRVRRQRLQIMRELLALLPKDMLVVDMGSGNGSTLNIIREVGFKNSIGIEYTEKGIEASKEVYGFERDKDVILGDAGNTPFPNRHFGLVFSEGLWEHFKNPEPYMDEFIRIADKYIMVIQPNHFSPMGMLMKVGWELLNSKKGGVKEYSFRIEYFTKYLRQRGFELVHLRPTGMNEQVVILYKRV